ncbi:low molecular weight protein-tyrosine-phosphatase [Tessaracoccus sp. OH4464_COT-324]|uniref:low molecular weight protein-tyrosine-phosphatase n=1 Tax=Tessaracoccus sp. OH4464_COT-324 TaxID=2491059 RepID=UPI000F63BCD4|nr:low molecular weight protein-tyrosine-phosphatase [Tessaracoccus sp. OH4464_COT-324]RRD44766.1 low molecular weight phosphotyrosine protein phosphatase [Tessaracoccus sp. OH4464_COT-324]
MHIMFICHGNICRSAMAERVARKLADERGLDVIVSSTGISSEEQGNPIDHRARRLLTRRGYRADGHQARRITAENSRGVDLFVVAEQRHADLLGRLGIDPTKVRLVTDFDPESTPGAPLKDPWYGDMSDFEETLAILERAVPRILDEA